MLTCHSQETVIDTGNESAELPPLRNPPLLETADDLATLSHLNEPSGAVWVLFAYLGYLFNACLPQFYILYDFVTLSTVSTLIQASF